MPFRRTRFDYTLIILLFILFFWSFFIGSSFGDLHFSSSAGRNDDPAFVSHISIAVFIIPIFIIYLMISIYALEGKPKLKEIDKKMVVFKIKLIIKNKIREGLDEYYAWVSSFKKS
jgi:hypothetical protein